MVTARAVIVAPVTWSKAPPSFFTFQRCAGTVSRPVWLNCVIQGRAWDVAVDLRPGAGFGRWTAAELSATAMNALFLPEGIAHGFLTLEPDTQILYQMGKYFEPGHADGLCWDDPDLAIEWPAAPAVIADKDRSWPALQDRDDLTRTGGTR